MIGNLASCVYEQRSTVLRSPFGQNVPAFAQTITFRSAQLAEHTMFHTVADLAYLSNASLSHGMQLDPPTLFRVACITVLKLVPSYKR